MRLSPLFLGMGLLIASGFATASEGCESPTTQLEMTECSAQAYGAADTELNESYQMLVSQLKDNAPALEKLRTAQRAWIGFRDAECAFESSAVEGGSAQPMVRNGCLEKVTAARIERLHEYASCEEGDLSCSH
ncbi:lysozyme inhibitor LprI family protein [Vreelandella profundi]|uniref:lysozyme inhibitor LprI family protein n=1 Tax=Vreelandella profundi TaxID=2852117 RepID=UPI001EF10BFE|nr:lysozyme inhibitor LprI family protein [Halomonas profundi]